MKLALHLILLLLLLLPFPAIYGQKMEITDAATAPLTPEKLIREILLGGGVDVLSVKFDGDPAAIGYFKNGFSAIGIERGILLTTGSAAGLDCKGASPGAACVGIDVASTDNNSNASDKDLEAIASSSIHDAAIFTITFIPKSDTLRFNYVFASEEYPEWSCTEFNDVFGFFISGPGIEGPYENKGINIARIPGTDLPVTINNVHPPNPTICSGKYEHFYNDNSTSIEQPVYDGFLSVFTAEAAVIPCQIYTIKIAIGDVSDSFWDSGVFLEAKSFGTTSLQAVYATASKDEVITEGCEAGRITFQLGRVNEQDFPLQYSIIGTAINGTDYERIPDSLVIPAGVSSLTIEINPLEDGMAESRESVGISYQKNLCEKDTIWLYIQDNSLRALVANVDTSICAGNSVKLSGSLSVLSTAEQVFRNNTKINITNGKPATSSIDVKDVKPVRLGPGIIRSVCLSITHPWVEDLDIYLISPSGHFLELSTDNGGNCDNYDKVCFSPMAVQPINYGEPWSNCPPGGAAPFNNKTFYPEGVWEDLWDGNFPTNGTWQLLILDDEMGNDGSLTEWSITFEPYYISDFSWESPEALSCTDCLNPLATPVNSASYLFKGFDNFGCISTDSVQIKVRNALAAPELTCSEINTNSITFDWTEVVGATAYQLKSNGVEWTHSDLHKLSYSLSGLKPGDTIRLDVQGLGPCGGEIATVQCGIPSCVLPILSEVKKTPASCPEIADGTIMVAASGGASPYVYSLGGIDNSTGQFGQLAAGTFTISVTDQAGCSSSKKFNIDSPSPLDLTYLSNPSGCSGNLSGSIDLSLQGGTLPYSFSWSNGQTTKNISGLAPGSYSVTVSDKNNCTTSATITVSQSQAISLTHSTESNNCKGDKNGKVNVTASGGSGKLSFSWTGPGAFISNAKDLIGLAAGVYNLTLTDSLGCSVTLNANILEPEQSLLVSINKPAEICYGSKSGSLDVMVTGGTQPYGYFWSNGQTTASSTNLGADTYTVTVIDSKGCIQINQATILQLGQLTVELSQKPASCNNGKDGEASVSKIKQGGTEISTAGFTYRWNLQNKTTQNIDSLQAGANYRVTVTNVLGCTATSSINIGNPPLLEASIASVVEPSCANGSDGSATIQVAGGTLPYTYTWGQNTGSQNSQTAIQLGAGDYSVTATDSKGCSATSKVSIGEPPPMKVTFENKAVNCHGGKDGNSLVKANGGAAPYQFRWSNGSTGNRLIDVQSAFYNVTITDAKGCSQINNTYITQPDSALSASISVTDVTCNGLANGKISLSARGGTPPYNYSSNGKTFSNSPVLISLQAGYHSVFIRDRNGCQYELNPVLVNQPSPFYINLGPDTLVYFGTVLRLTPKIEGKDTAELLSYVWESSNPLSALTDPTWKNAEINVKGPTFVSVTATDKNGCQAKDLINIQVFEYRNIEVPTAFSPGLGGASVNDQLHIHGNSILIDKIARFRIFNRWGTLLYEAVDFPINSLIIGWDGTFKGKEMPGGIYTWFAEVDFIDGSRETYKGHTTLVR